MNRYPANLWLRAADAEPASYADQATEPPWDELDPGIRDVVRLLWVCGFCPTDSGDGETKVKAGWPADEVLDTPHVFMIVPNAACVLDEANRLHVVLSHRVGVEVEPVGGRVSIEASYDPASGCGILVLSGLLDSMLPEAYRYSHFKD